MSHVTIDWMIDRAEPYGLLLDALRKQELRSSFNPYDKLNDSRRGFAGYYRYKPRNLEEIYSAPPYKPSMRRDIEYMAGELIGKRSAQKGVSRNSTPFLLRHFWSPRRCSSLISVRIRRWFCSGRSLLSLQPLFRAS